MNHEKTNPELRHARDEALATLVTARERQVLRALSGRRTNKEIAEDLVIGVRTVESHVSSLLRKLWADDRRHLEAIAAAHLDGRLGASAGARRSRRSRTALVAFAVLVAFMAACGGSTDGAVAEDAVPPPTDAPPSTVEETTPTASPTPTAAPTVADTTPTASPTPTAAPPPTPTATAGPQPEPESALPAERSLDGTGESAVDSAEADATDNGGVEIVPIECRNLDPCRAVLRAPSPLYDGAMVDIEIEGWTPGQTVGVVQCADPAAHPAGAVILEDSGLPFGIYCDTRSFTRVLSTRDGAIVWTFEIKAGERMGERTAADVTCDEAHACILNVFASDVLRFREDEPRVVFPLDFGTDS